MAETNETAEEKDMEEKKDIEESLEEEETQDVKPKKVRQYRQVIKRQYKHWVGNGYHVRPAFGEFAFTEEVSPFLMFDYSEPRHFNPIEREHQKRGLGYHPRRGHVCVNIMFEGEMLFKDAIADIDGHQNKGVLFPGEVQWCTTGMGVIHKLFHTQDFSKRGGTFELCQIWINILSKDKMMKPTEQVYRKPDIPIVQTEFGWVRIIAGTYNGVTGPAEPMTPLCLWEVFVKDGHTARLPTEFDHNCSAFVRRGRMKITDEKFIEKYTATTFKEGDELVLEAIKDSSIIFMSGQPLGEDIAANGCFTMCTQHELYNAITDFRVNEFVKPGGRRPKWEEKPEVYDKDFRFKYASWRPDKGYRDMFHYRGGWWGYRDRSEYGPGW